MQLLVVSFKLLVKEQRIFTEDLLMECKEAAVYQSLGFDGHESGYRTNLALDLNRVAWTKVSLYADDHNSTLIPFS